MANTRRVEARKALNEVRIRSIAESGKIDDDLLRSAGMSSEDIGQLRIRQHQAEQLAQFKADNNGYRT